MSATNLSKVVAAKRARLKVLEQLPSSPTRDQELLAVSSELRKLYKLVSDRMNAIPWNEEKKQLRDLREELDRAPIWGYELDVNLSTKRLNELDTELTAGGLNNSIRKKLQKGAANDLGSSSKDRGTCNGRKCLGIDLASLEVTS